MSNKPDKEGVNVTRVLIVLICVMLVVVVLTVIGIIPAVSGKPDGVDTDPNGPPTFSDPLSVLITIIFLLFIMVMIELPTDH